MSYYMGDYYRARSYRGDPGFLSFLGGIAKGAVGMIPGVGPALSEGLGKIMTHAAPAAAGAAVSGGVTAGAKQAIEKAGKLALKHPVLTAAGAAGVGTLAGAAASHVASKLLGAGGKRHRRMNPCNPRALRRALRRAHSFAKFARKVVRVEHRFKKPRGAWPRGHSRKRKR
jgi:hypothetical protein